LQPFRRISGFFGALFSRLREETFLQAPLVGNQLRDFGHQIRIAGAMMSTWSPSGSKGPRWNQRFPRSVRAVEIKPILNAKTTLMRSSSYETDCWGFGCRIIEMLTGVSPWYGEFYLVFLLKVECNQRNIKVDIFC
jgi:hypothetical protein